MNQPSDFSVQAHMPQAFEAKRAETKKEKKAVAVEVKK